MTIEQRSANTWRIKQMIEGQWYRVTVDHKPSKKEALELLAEAMKSGGSSEKGSFAEACQKYISMKSNILSPRTVREYNLYPQRLPQWFRALSVSKMSAADVQECINELSRTLSPKTVRSLHGFINAVLGNARPGLTLHTTLPKLAKKEPYIPKKEDLRRILQEAEGGCYYIPVRLACYGLRRGEICALEIGDLDEKNVIHITKDLVQDPSGKWIKKPPKTPSSVRDVPIDSALADLIREQGYIYKGAPGQISKFLNRAQKKLGLESFSLHKLRHLFASLLLDEGYDLKTIQELGGWQGNETVSKVYLHSLKLKNEEERRRITSSISGFIGDSVG